MALRRRGVHARRRRPDRVLRTRHRMNERSSMRKSMVIVALGLALAACNGGKTGSTASPSPSTSARLSTTGTLTLISPKPGEVVDGPSVTVRVAVTGARVVTASTTTVAPDLGHIHVELDGETLSILAGESYKI